MGNSCKCLRTLFVSLVSFLLLHGTFSSRAARFDYSSLLENLHDAVRTNLKDSTEEKQSTKLQVQNSLSEKAIHISIGKVFKETLADILGRSEEEFGLFEVLEAGKSSLPKWLRFDHGRNKLVGIPTQSDIGRYTLVAKSMGEDGRPKKSDQFELIVEKHEPVFLCKQGGEMVVATIIFNTDIQKLDVKGRLKLIRNFADFMDIDLRTIHVSEGNGLEDYGQISSSIISAGPGDRLSSRQPGLTLSWQVRCGTNAAGVRSVALLKSASGTGAIHRSVGVEVVGWFLTERQSRVRRQLPAPAATPVATPAASLPTPKFVTSVFGTPAISSAPTVSTITKEIKPTPVKSTVIFISKTPTTMPPITTEEATTQPTTAEPTTKLTTRPTTQPTTKEPTTEEPTTQQPTTQQPTTKKAEPTTVKEKTAPPFTEPTNKEPEIINSIDNLVEQVGQPLKLRIKDDMFSDEDGNARNLRLKLIRLVNKTIHDVEKDNWIIFDEIERHLYVLPTAKNVGRHEYAIQATDSGGLSVNAVFYVTVKKNTVAFNHYFNVTLDLDYDAFIKSVKNRVDLLYRIASATKVDYRTLRAQRFARGSVIVQYSTSAVENADGDVCNSIAVEAYKSSLTNDNFKSSLAPEYKVTGTSAATQRPCADSPRGKPRGVPSGSKGPGKWWEIVMIPIIVVVALLLVIGLIFCCLYRRKRRFEPAKEDQNTYIFHKKPVIFMEEYEEKPDLLSLEPRILPNEKPPLQAPPYHPRSSTPDGTEGAASSTVSTESDEKAPLTNHQTSPRDSPRKLAYSRSPPPYTGS